MPRKAHFLLLVLTVVGGAGPLLAQEQPFSSSLSPQQTMAKQQAVAAHAAKRNACKAQAKEAGLGLLARRKFVRDCMAAK